MTQNRPTPSSEELPRFWTGRVFKASAAVSVIAPFVFGWVVTQLKGGEGQFWPITVSVFFVMLTTWGVIFALVSRTPRSRAANGIPNTTDGDEREMAIAGRASRYSRQAGVSATNLMAVLIIGRSLLFDTPMHLDVWWLFMIPCVMWVTEFIALAYLNRKM